MRYVLTISILALSASLATWGAAAVFDEDEAAVREVLNAYLAGTSFPNAPAVDPQMFAADITAFWSDGRTYRGREAMVKAIKDSIPVLARDFVKFEARARDVKLRKSGSLCWLTCRLELVGKLNKGRGDFRRQVRSTFIFEKRGERWQMVHEHSSRSPESGGGG